MVGFHDYDPSLSDGPQAFDTEYAAYPNVPIWMTEGTGTYGASSQAYNFEWESQHDLMEPLQNWVSASIYLNLVLNSDGGPHVGGCGSGKPTKNPPCRGMVTLNSDGSYTLNEDYYDWAQSSKFILPGATHICSDIVDLTTDSVDACSAVNPTSWIPTNGDDLIDTVAFKNPNGSIVLVAMNTAQDGSTASSKWKAVDVSVPSNALSDSGDLTSVSCSDSTPSTCAAVGAYLVSKDDYQGLIETATGSSPWSAIEAPLPPDGVGLDGGSFFESASCSGIDSCVAVGNDLTDTQSGQGAFIDSYEDGKWTAI